MAKSKDDSTIWLLAGVAVAYWLYKRNPTPAPGAPGPALINLGHDVLPSSPRVIYDWNIKLPRVGSVITLPAGQAPPTAPPGLQWYAPPSGAQALERTYTLEPEGSYHPLIDPSEIT